MNLPSFLKKQIDVSALLKKKIYIPSCKQIVYVLRTITRKEKIIFFSLAIVFALSFSGVLWEIHKKISVIVPKRGGELVEGIVGIPRFINPLLEISDVDRDLTSLIYSGLMRADNKQELVLDLAESYEISEDGLTYTFVLKPDLLWHDKQPLTTDDILFTIEQAQDSGVKSTKRAGLEGVRVEKIDDRTVKFILSKPYAPFLNNTTIGILPKHLWKDATSNKIILSDFNIEPVGSGPYKIKKINRDSSKIVTSYVLVSNEDFALGEPYIEEITLKFYPSEEQLILAYQGESVDSISAVSPQFVEDIQRTESVLKTLSLPRIFGVFLNQNNDEIFAYKEVREALNMSIDRTRIINEVFRGFGAELDGPLPSETFRHLVEIKNSKDSISASLAEAGLGSSGSPLNQESFGEDEKEIAKLIPAQEAKAYLEEKGWGFAEVEEEGEEGISEGGESEESVATKIERGPLQKKFKKELVSLEFSLSTSDVPELKQVAELVKEMWEEMGAKVDLKIFEVGDLNKDVIRPRNYDTLLFGEIVGRNPDPFVFWHSSQRNDPGLNIAMYANITANKLMEEIRVTSDSEEREKKYLKLQEEISNDIPAVFLYSPKFIYLVPQKIKGLEEMESIAVPSERFSQIYKWHIKTKYIWKVFADK